MFAHPSLPLGFAAALAFTLGITLAPRDPQQQGKKEPGLESLPPTRLVEVDADAIGTIHRIRTGSVVDRNGILKGIAAERGELLANLRAELSRAGADIDLVIGGQAATTGEKLKDALAAGAPDSWVKGYVVDGWTPRAETPNGEPRLRLRTTSGVVAPECDLRQMCDRGVVLLKGQPEREMLRVVAYTQKAVSGAADLYLITIGMGTGWGPGLKKPFELLVDGVPTNYGITENGVHMIARLEQGRHVIELQGAPHVDRDFFEFRFVRVLRL